MDVSPLLNAAEQPISAECLTTRWRSAGVVCVVGPPPSCHYLSSWPEAGVDLRGFLSRVLTGIRELVEGGEPTVVCIIPPC